MNIKKLIIFPVLVLLISGCASSPIKNISYDATFEAIDSSKDGIITIDEFNNRFPEGGKKFPAEADADNDGNIYPDEWYEFREKKGYVNPQN